MAAGRLRRARERGERCGRCTASGALLGAARALLDDIGARAEIPWERPLLAETAEAIRAQLGDDALAAAAAGRSTLLDEIVREALDGAAR